MRLISVTLGSLALVALTVSPASAQCELDMLASPDSHVSDFFGGNCDVDGDLLVVGAGGYDVVGENDGTVFVFRRNCTSWELETQILSPNSEHSAGFAFPSVSGNRIAIGASEESDTLDEQGRAYVFRFDGTGWIEEATLVAPDPSSNARFGGAIDLDGNRLIVGASGDDELAGNAGAAYIFEHDGQQWNLLQKIFASDGATEDHFGDAVALHGDFAIVGAWRHGDDEGAAYVFRCVNGLFIEDQKILPSNAATNREFGYSVAIDGDTALVGMRRDIALEGTVYVFRRESGTWSEEAMLQASDGDNDDRRFGFRVALSGDVALVGAHFDDTPEVDRGSAYLFVRDGTTWSELSKIVPEGTDEGDRVGYDVALDGRIGIVGVSYDDVEFGTDGSVRVVAVGGDCDDDDVFDACEVVLEGAPDCNDNLIPDDCDIASGTSEDGNGDGVPDECILDCNANGVPDHCEEDCNENGIPDDCDIASGSSLDCNSNGIPDECDILSGVSEDADENGVPDECEQQFVRGNCDAMGPVTLADAVFLLDVLFLGGGPAVCDDACDVDDDGNLALNDPVQLLNALFLGAEPPAEPFPSCGVDPTDGDPLTCSEFGPCP